MKAIILAAGEGTRLRPLTKTTPKPLIKLKNKSIIEWSLDNLNKINEIDEVLIIINYLGEKIIKYIEKIKNKYKFKINFAWQKEKTGTMGALLEIKDKLKNQKFLVLNGDEIHFEKNIKKIIKENWAMSFYKKQFPKEYYTFDFDKNNYILNFRPQTEKEQKKGSWNYSGMGVFDDKIFSFPMKSFKNKEIGLPQTILKQKEKYPIKAVFEDKWISINTIEDLEHNELLL